MSARFQTAARLGFLALATAFSCSVFPDEAVLPQGTAGTSAAGTSSAAGAGGSESVHPNAGAGAETSAGAGAEASSGAGEGGAGGVGGDPSTSQGGAPGGAGGAGGAPSCASPQSTVGDVTADTWIDAAKPNNNSHGGEPTLSVIAGGAERRALLQVQVPTLPTGAVLLRATLALHLESNADVDLVTRRLAVRQLEHEVIEARASWLNWNNGNRTWKQEGGDFGPALDKATLPAGTSRAAVDFDVTVAVEQALTDLTPE
ncbi:MAG: hypothetical protein ABUL60_19430, partial [Myxococcales bacterium]